MLSSSSAPSCVCSLALVLFVLQVTMARSPPTSILTLLPASWAPTRLVGTALHARVLVALMRVLSKGGFRAVGVCVAPGLR